MKQRKTGCKGRTSRKKEICCMKDSNVQVVYDESEKDGMERANIEKGICMKDSETHVMSQKEMCCGSKRESLSIIRG
jgi:hypothetical protein